MRRITELCLQFQVPYIYFNSTPVNIFFAITRIQYQHFKEVVINFIKLILKGFCMVKKIVASVVYIDVTLLIQTSVDGASLLPFLLNHPPPITQFQRPSKVSSSPHHKQYLAMTHNNLYELKFILNFLLQVFSSTNAVSRY